MWAFHALAQEVAWDEEGMAIFDLGWWWWWRSGGSGDEGNNTVSFLAAFYYCIYVSDVNVALYFEEKRVGTTKLSKKMNIA